MGVGRTSCWHDCIAFKICFNIGKTQFAIYTILCNSILMQSRLTWNGKVFATLTHVFFCSLVLDLSVPQCNGLSIYSTSSATSSLVSTRSPSLLYTNSTIHVDEIFTASKYDIVAQVWEVKTHFCTQYRMTGLHRTFHFKCNGVLFTAREVQKWAKTSHRSSWTSLHHCTGERLHWGVN